MPLAVPDGALATHPVAAAKGDYRTDPSYDPATTRLGVAEGVDVLGKLAQLNPPHHVAKPEGRRQD